MVSWTAEITVSFFFVARHRGGRWPRSPPPETDAAHRVKRAGLAQTLGDSSPKALFHYGNMCESGKSATNNGVFSKAVPNNGVDIITQPATDAFVRAWDLARTY